MGKSGKVKKCSAEQTKEKIHSVESTKKEAKSSILKTKKELQTQKRQKTAKDKKDDKQQEKGGLEEIDDLFNTAAKAKKAEKAEKELKGTSISSSHDNSNPSRQNPVKIKCNYDRSDINQLQKSSNSKCAWASDGLGGVFNAEGYTGRKEANSGYKIYKAHLFNKKGFGNTKDCPFDCQCCFI